MFYDLYLELCKRNNVSPTRAALEIGVSKSTPTTWKKRGLTPQGETLSKIADYFDVTTDYLLTGEQKEKAPTQEDERTIDDDDLKFALWGGADDIDDADLEDVRRYAAFVRERKKDKRK